MFHWLKELLLTIERHTPLMDVLFKGLGGLAAVAGGIWAVKKYYSDRAGARRTKELDLLREAYFGLFSTIPIQQERLGKFFVPNRDPFQISPEGFHSLHKLHLLANRDALKCLVRMNGIYHEGMMQLILLKKKALDLDDLKLLCERQRADAKSPEVAANLDRIAVQLTTERAAAWNAFIDRFKALLAQFGATYREFLPLARKEIDLAGDMSEVIKAMEFDQQVAFANFETSMDSFRQTYGLVPPPPPPNLERA